MKKPIKDAELKDDLSNYDPAAYKSPSVTVDIAICSIVGGKLSVLLVKRKYPPFRGRWAIPGGFVNLETAESLEQTAERELKEETGLSGIYFDQLKAYGDPRRDPRKRVITVVYYALLPQDKIGDIRAGDDAAEAQWFDLRNLPKNLAFDHSYILDNLCARLKRELERTSIGFYLVPTFFSWDQLLDVYEIILGKKLARTQFERWIRARHVIKRINITQGEKGRPHWVMAWGGDKNVL